MPLAALLTCYAVAAPGLEALVAGELTALGIAPTSSEPGGVEFPATADQLFDTLLGLRVASRVTVRLGGFSARTFGELERHAATIDWASVITPGGAVHFRVTSKKSRLYHQDGIAERLERLVAAAVPGVTAVRAASAAEALEEDVFALPGVQRIVVRVMRDTFTLSADASGALLHLRGYRQAVAKAPLRETLAAALVMASGWTTDQPLLDPMCGSGTIAIEAALLARRIAPGRSRHFAADRWPGFAAALAAARQRAVARELPRAPATLSGQDRDAGAIDASRANAERAGVAQDCEFTQAAISNVADDRGTGWVVTNPPYGTRVGEKGPLRDLYATLGQVMRARRPAWRLAMLGADRALEGQVRAGFEDVLHTTNGGLPVRIVRSDPAR